MAFWCGNVRLFFLQGLLLAVCVIYALTMTQNPVQSD